VTTRAPFDPQTTDALVRAARRVRRGRLAARADAHHSVYVVLLECAAGDHGLYVGLTGLTPDERYRNHKAGYQASRSVRKYGTGLLPALYRHLNPLDWQRGALAEVALAEALAETGVRVKQG
jgi:hypothetical protein